jgi:hypothetical protein
MTPSRRFFVLFFVLALVVLACSVTFDMGTWPFAAPIPQLSARDNVSTMVAQTLQAMTQAALSATPVSTSTPSPTATTTQVPIPPTLSVSLATNCYAGPSSNYGFVITIHPGTTVTVTGKDAADNYWIIDVPGYPGTLCWLSGQYARLEGDIGNLPAPATPLASNYTLSEPRNLRVSCTTVADPDSDDSWWHEESETTVTLRWTNTDPDQTGVRIYRNGWRVATLGPHASSFTETIFHHWRHGLTYGVQAIGNGEVSSIVTIYARRCRED